MSKKKSNGTMSLNLRKFDMSSIQDDKIVVLIGKRETGKSFLTKDLLYYHQDIPVGTVVSATEGANTFYSNIVPKLFIHEEYTPELVKNVVKRQEKAVKKFNEERKNFGRTNIDPRGFLIFDDCLFDKSWLKDKNIRRIFMNGRHYKMMFVLTMQYSLGVPPNLRTNIDYVFILREPLNNNRRRLYEHYCSMFPTYESFCAVMDQCTENYECLVINNNAKSNKIEDQVFWYKADPHPDFKIGAPVFWQYSQSNYQDDSDSDENQIDLNDYQGKKHINLHVNKIGDDEF